MDDDSNMSEPNRLLIDESVSSSAPASPSCSSQQQPKMAAVIPKTTRKGHRITQFIEDKTLRVRSYFRRRHIPFKRAFELDLQCGTQSLLLQIDEDIEECLYYGHDKLVEQFLSNEGINLAHANNIIVEEKQKLGRFAIEDPEILEFLGGGKNRRKSGAVGMKNLDEDDDEYSPTVKEKERREREKRKEVAQRVQDGDYLSNIQERTKVFKSRKDSLVTKTSETDSVCGTKSFLLIVNMDQEGAFYHGGPSLVTQFFTSGVSSKNLHRNFNVRAIEPDELEQNTCSVPHCLVTRNTLSRWRLAAIKMFKFPNDLPMTLYLCPEADRERWIAEMDLDPNKTTGKIAVCSLHFKEGLPTDDYPLPTELLTEINTAGEFRGTRRSTVSGQGLESSDDNEPEDTEVYYTLLKSKQAKRTLKQRTKLATIARRKHRQWIPSVDYNDKKSLKTRHRKIAHDSLYGSRIQCRFCTMKILGTKQYFRHVRQFHLPGILKCDTQVEETLPIPSVVSPVKPSSQKKVKLPPVNLEPEEVSALLSMFYPKPRAKPMNPKKKYVCAVCKSACDLYGLFFHMKQVHQGLLCCYCTKLFKKVGDLEVHIKNVHRVPKRYYHSSRQFVNCSGHRYNFVCSVCSDIMSLKDLDRHACKTSGKKQFDCPHCGRVFNLQTQLDIHLCNGWCKEMRWLDKPSLEDSRKLYKVLTGKESDASMFGPLEEKKAEVVKPTVVPSQPKKPKCFNVSDRQVLAMFSNESKLKKTTTNITTTVLHDLPVTGSIFCSHKARGISTSLKKELRESGYRWSLAAECEKHDTKLNDEAIKSLDIIRVGKNFCVQEFVEEYQQIKTEPLPIVPLSPQRATPIRKPNRRFGPKVALTQQEAMENKENTVQPPAATEERPSTGGLSLKISIPIKKETKAERITRAAKEIPANFEKLRVVLEHFADSCLFCQQAHIICVDAVFLLSHLLIIHDRQVVNSYLGEDAQDSIYRIKNYLRDTKIKEVIFSYKVEPSMIMEPTFQCCYCSNHEAKTYSQLFAHLEVGHGSKVLTCHLCQNIFLNYGSFRSHVCFGPPSGPNQPLKAKFSCMVCQRQDLSTFLDFQRHVRQTHDTCEICFTQCSSQEELHSHCLAHSQELMCMKCFLTYDSHKQFRKHLYYKHEEEHKMCVDCHQKTWQHVYHFCIQPKTLDCEVCDAHFDNLKKYSVHLRTHTGATPHSCSVRGCKKSYVSKQLLLKHHIRRHPELRVVAAAQLESRRNQKLLERMGATSLDHINLCRDIIMESIVGAIIPHDNDEGTPDPEDLSVEAKLLEDEDLEEYNPIDAAVASIMGPDGNFDVRKSPVKPVIPPTFARPSPIAMPSLLSIPKTSVIPPGGGGSLLKQQPPPPVEAEIYKPVDPLKMMLDQESGRTPLPAPSAILPPTSFKDFLGGGSSKKKSTIKDQDVKKEAEPVAVNGDVDDTKINPVLGGIWNQDLMFVTNADNKLDDPSVKKTKGCKVMKPKYQIDDFKKDGKVITNSGLKSLTPQTTRPGEWEVMLSESSGSDNEGPRKPMIKEKTVYDKRVALKDHDYCFAAFALTKEEEKKEDLSEMDKIMSNVALGALDNSLTSSIKSSKRHKRKKDGKKKKKKRKKHRKKGAPVSDKDSSSSSDSDAEVDVMTPDGRRQNDSSKKTLPKKRGPTPKYHIPGASQGVGASSARPHFSSSENEDDLTSGGELVSSDLDTDFSADESSTARGSVPKRAAKPTAKAAAFAETVQILAKATKEEESMEVDEQPPQTPSLKLKIKLPQQQKTPTVKPQWDPKMNKSKSKKRTPKRKKNDKKGEKGRTPTSASAMSKKMRESLALNRASSSSSSEDDDMSDIDNDEIFQPAADTSTQGLGYSYLSNNSSLVAAPIAHVPPADTKLYCVCQSPHDDVSEMIGCDAPDCRLEWFHFECVGIMVPPEGQWYCPECTKRYNIRATY